MHTDNTALWFVYVAVIAVFIILIKYIYNIVKDGWKAYKRNKNRK